MALTKEILTGNEALADLSDDQVSAIETLSKNDEDKVIGQKIGELHGLYDKDVKEVSGIDKQDGEKSYDYVKRALSTFKTKAENNSELQTQLEAAQGKVQELEKAVKENSTDEALKQKLKDAEDKVSNLEGQLETKTKEFQTKEKELNEKVTQIQVDTEFDRAAAGLKFKDGYPESVQKTLLSSAKAEILNTVNPDWVESDGKKVMVLRNKDGEILRNKANKLEPYTVQELISEKLSDVLSSGEKKKGGGSGKEGEDADTVTLVEVASAKSQVEADEVITKYLLQQGYTKGSAEFSEKQAEIRKENNVEKLPLR